MTCDFFKRVTISNTPTITPLQGFLYLQIETKKKIRLSNNNGYSSHYGILQLILIGYTYIAHSY